MQKSILMLSDQQLVTGIAILAAGFLQLQRGLSTFYWQILVELVWFSSLTHLATLTALRQYFQKNPAIRAWRLLLMLALAALQIAVLVPTGNPDWPTTQGRPDSPQNIPAHCFFAYKHVAGWNNGLATWNMSISMAYIVLTFSMRVSVISPSASEAVRLVLRIKPKAVLRTWLERLQTPAGPVALIYVRKIAYTVVLASYVSTKATLDLYLSTHWEVSYH